MDSRHLLLLRELAERGSVGAVAAATHRTASAVSQQLRTAQRDLGVTLVEPDGRGVRLTPAGRVLAESAIDVEAALARARARLDALLGEPTGEVGVVALPSAAAFLGAPLLASLGGGPVRVRLEDRDVAERGFADLVRDTDIVIGHSLRGRVPEGAGGLTCVALCREPIDIALPTGHRLCAAPRVLPRDVVGEPWIGVPPGFPFDEIRRSIEQVTGAATEVRQRVRDNRIVESLVAAGLGIALLPRFTTRCEGLELRALAGVGATRWVVAMSRPDRAERGAVRAVLAELERIAAEVAGQMGAPR